MNIKKYTIRTIAAKKKRILIKEKELIEAAVKASKVDNLFIIEATVLLQKETEEALKEAGYKKNQDRDCVKYLKINNYNANFSSCMNNIILSRIDSILKEEISEESEDLNVSNAYRCQKKNVIKAIYESVERLEDYQFRFPTIRIEFEFCMPKLRYNKDIEKELEDAGYVREYSIIGMSSYYTGKFKTTF